MGTRIPGFASPAAVRRSAGLAAMAGAAALTTLTVLDGGPGATVVPLSGSALLVTGVGVTLVRRARSTRRARVRRSGVLEACDALAAGLRSGQPPQWVLARVATDVDTLRSAAAAAALGGDVPAALRAAARLEGAEGLGPLAAAWTVAQRSGAGLADVVSRIAEVVRADTEQRRQVDVALGTSRSTARLLAGLPVMGVALGTGIDADPVGVLLGTVGGAWCLATGTALAGVGVLWVERLADVANR
ncbi:MAG TPA: type II secretion system F family protein [Nocardioidaceae bacterium]|nr:type II secretion system F family protein [Nocardioidaceae bacterium]